MRFLYIAELLAMLTAGWIAIFEIIVPMAMGRRLFPVFRDLLGCQTKIEKGLDEIRETAKDVEDAVEANQIANEIETKLDSIKKEEDHE